MAGRIIMTRGLPASGKSTFSKELVLKGEGKVKRVCKDDIRNMVDAGKYSRDREKQVLVIRDALVEQFLVKGQTVIVDDTNLSSDHEARLRQLAKAMDAEFQVQDFTHVTVSECLKRNKGRVGEVPEEVIFKMWKDYIYKPVEYNSELPNVVVCDLDGTVANLNGRNPYDASTCESDLPNQLVLDIVHDFYQYRVEEIVFMSGRDKKWMQETERWLNRHFGNEYLLFMRGDNDTRPDEVIKRELYEQHVKDFFNVVAWIDDRPKIIRMVRYDLCLPVLDVGWGIEF